MLGRGRETRKKCVRSSATEGRRKFRNISPTSEGRYLRSSTGIARARERRKWETLRREGAVSSERETKKERFETPAKLRIREAKTSKSIRSAYHCARHSQS